MLPSTVYKTSIKVPTIYMFLIYHKWGSLMNKNFPIYGGSNKDMIILY